MLKIYTGDPDLVGTPSDYLLSRQIGYLAGAGGASATITLTESVAAEEDVVVRRFRYIDSENICEWGQLLTLNTDYTVNTTAGTVTIIESEGGYDDDVTTSGNWFVVFTTGKQLFEDVTFLVSSGSSQNVKYQKLWLRAEDNEYTNVTIGMASYIGAYGALVGWFGVKVDSAETHPESGYTATVGGGTANIFPSVTENTTISGTDYISEIWIKAEVPIGTPVENFRNIYLSVDTVERSNHQ